MLLGGEAGALDARAQTPVASKLPVVWGTPLLCMLIHYRYTKCTRRHGNTTLMYRAKKCCTVHWANCTVQ